MTGRRVFLTRVASQAVAKVRRRRRLPVPGWDEPRPSACLRMAVAGTRVEAGWAEVLRRVD